MNPSKLLLLVTQRVIFLARDRGLKFYTITLVCTLFLCAVLTRSKFSQLWTATWELNALEQR